MANQEIEDFFAGPVMTEVAQAPLVKRGIPRFLPAELWTPGPSKPASTQFKYKQYTGNRASSKVVNHDAPSLEVEVTAANWQYATALGTREHFVVDQEFLYQLMSPIPYVSDLAKQEYQRRMAEFYTRQETLRTNAVASVFATGAIYFDSGGNILTTSSGNYGGNMAGFTPQSLSKTSQYPLLGGPIVGDWSNVAFDIPGSLRNLRESFLFLTNFDAATILYGSAIPSYLTLNTSMGTYLSRQPSLNQQFMDTNEVPKGLLDYDWKPAYKQYFVPSSNSGTTQGTPAPWFPANQITVIAPVTDEWYEFVEAGTLIPKGIAAMGQDVSSLLSNIEVANGRFSYAEMATNPIKLKAIVGDYFFPTVKNGNLVWIITVS